MTQTKNFGFLLLRIIRTHELSVLAPIIGTCGVLGPPQFKVENHDYHVSRASSSIELYNASHSSWI